MPCILPAHAPPSPARRNAAPLDSSSSSCRPRGQLLQSHLLLHGMVPSARGGVDLLRAAAGTAAPRRWRHGGIDTPAVPSAVPSAVAPGRPAASRRESAKPRGACHVVPYPAVPPAAAPRAIPAPGSRGRLPRHCARAGSRRWCRSRSALHLAGPGGGILWF